MPAHLLRMNCNHLRKSLSNQFIPRNVTLRMLIEHDSRTLRLKKKSSAVWWVPEGKLSRERFLDLLVPNCSTLTNLPQVLYILLAIRMAE